VNDAYPIPTCHVAGHSLARRGSEWIDAAIHCMPHAPRVRVRFASSEFFELLRTFPNLLTLTGISRNLQLALGGTVYEIHE
jgi:hypothetical protein